MSGLVLMARFTNIHHLTHLLLCFLGNGITLEGAVPTEQDSQPKPAKRARTSFTAEQLQVGHTATSNATCAQQ